MIKKKRTRKSSSTRVRQSSQSKKKKTTHPKRLSKQKKQAKLTKSAKQKKPTRRNFESLLETRGTVPEALRALRFAGVSLGGGKTDKTALAVLEFFPDRQRVFLRVLREKISGKGGLSADHVLCELLLEEQGRLESVAFDAPLQFPKCIRCTLPCPGVENCKLPAIRWMRAVHQRRSESKRPNKMFTPYTERSAEIHIANELEEPFHPSQALGANAAPLAARAHFVRRRLSTPALEVYPKLSLWRMGCSLDINKSYLRSYRHSVDGDEARLVFLKTVVNKGIAFVYQQDLKIMVENNVAFEAFLCALTAYLKSRGQTATPPEDFPRDEIWIDYPVRDISWF